MYRNDVGHIVTLFQRRLKPYANVQEQRPSKILFHDRKKLEEILDE